MRSVRRDCERKNLMFLKPIRGGAKPYNVPALTGIADERNTRGFVRPGTDRRRLLLTRPFLRAQFPAGGACGPIWN